MLTKFNRNHEDLFKPDLGEKIGNFGLGLLRVGFGETIKISKLPSNQGPKDLNPTHYASEKSLHPLAQKISSIALFIIFFPITGVLATLGCIGWLSSKTIYQIEQFNNSIDRAKKTPIPPPLPKPNDENKNQTKETGHNTQTTDQIDAQLRTEQTTTGPEQTTDQRDLGENLNTEIEPATRHVSYSSSSYPSERVTRQTALIFYPTSDHNGAYEQERELPTRLQAMSKRFHVEFRRVDTIDKCIEVALEVLSRGQEITYLELAGHGTPRSIEFNQLEPFGNISNDSNHLAASKLSHLCNLVCLNGTIVTQSCKNGVELQGEKNMLQHIASIAKGRRVIGTIGSRFYIQIESLDPIRLRFIDVDTQDDITRSVIDYCN